MSNANTPAFDTTGQYLYFLSDREYAPQISTAEFNYATNRTTMVYALALTKTAKNPYPYEQDEVTIAADTTPSASPTPKPPETQEVVDLDGIEKRAIKVPLPADNYAGLTVNKGNLLYSVQPPFYYGRQADSQASVRVFSIKDRKESVLAQPAGGFTVSGDGSKLMTGGQGGFQIMDAAPLGDRTKKPVSTAAMVTEIDPQQEWAQIFNEVWRQYRDWFYVPNMHGFDWARIRDDYKKWLPSVAHRSDLNYVLSEMQSELTVQHAYIDGGDFNLPPRVRVALPGARFEVDKGANRYKISKIFEGQNEEDIYRSPLTEVGSEAKVGDYVLAINGEDVTTEKDIYSYLRGKADSTVTLTVNSSPSSAGARTVTFRPILNESDLLYMDWVENNRKRV